MTGAATTRKTSFLLPQPTPPPRAHVWVASGNPQLTLFPRHHSAHVSPTTFFINIVPPMHH
eukprot:9545110-Ditylum_brightwellii.AAC.1